MLRRWLGATQVSCFIAILHGCNNGDTSVQRFGGLDSETLAERAASALAISAYISSYMHVPAQSFLYIMAPFIFVATIYLATIPVRLSTPPVHFGLFDIACILCGTPPLASRTPRLRSSRCQLPETSGASPAASKQRQDVRTDAKKRWQDWLQAVNEDNIWTAHKYAGGAIYLTTDRTLSHLFRYLDSSSYSET